MSLGAISDQLPTYPNNIQGELRLILQTKDVFLVCYKHLEEYRRLVNEQNRLITKEFVQEQLQMGEDEISELKMELQDAESRLNARLRHNELLADHLAGLGFGSLETGGSARHMALVRSPQMRKNLLAQRGAGAGGISETRPPTHMIDNIALAMAEIHQEVRSKVKPLLDYYRDLFYLQLHFSLVLGQVCNYCMPLVTENIGLIDRIFFWSERPEFDLVRRAGDIGDRLKEIYTRAQTVLGVLAESVRFLQSKVELQKTLEQRFHERLDEQQKTKDKILRDVHTTKQNMDMLEEENDRLVGSLVKVDPSFVDSRHFFELAEGGGNLTGTKKPGSPKGTAQNNAEDNQEFSTISPVRHRSQTREGFDRDTQRDAVTPVRSGRRGRDLVTPSVLDNPMDEINNNKAISIASDTPARVVENKVLNKKKVDQEELDALLKEVRSKISVVKTRAREGSRSANRNNVSESSGLVSSVGDTGDKLTATETRSETTTPVPKNRVRRAKSRPRSKPQKGEGRDNDSPIRISKTKVRRRATSVERPEKPVTTKRHRPKSTVDEHRIREAETAHRRKHERKPLTPEKTQNLEELRSTSASTAAGDSGEQHMPRTGNLKSRLLGRTKDILEAALHRSSKTSSSTEPVTKSVREVESSISAGNVDHEDLNNDAVTSVSSFASLLVPDSSLGEPGLTPPTPIIPVRQLRALEPKNSSRHGTESRRLFRKNRKGGHVDILDLGQQPLPALGSDTLLTESGANEIKNYNLMNSFDTIDTSRPKRHRTKRGKSQTGHSPKSVINFVVSSTAPLSPKQNIAELKNNGAHVVSHSILWNHPELINFTQGN
ncbi:hypothetical protein CLF_101915 [Clonorchis sinensis]|uniref:DUF5743 domain-containing protein n=1 Tax=Clonorchis sinensis TaxID=79923 RepID=H2KPG2_CLOSI|nr:hypothetical protein CLF_101915 [Clonorchis sinensis]